MDKSKSTDPAREIALQVLSASKYHPNDMLRDVIRYAFGQLCWTMTDNELIGFLDELRKEISE